MGPGQRLRRQVGRVPGIKHVRRSVRQRRDRRPQPWEHLEPRDLGVHHELAVCAIFKDEADYLKEWLEFHLLVGVEKFILYNNGSTDGYEDVLAPYVERGVVTLYDIPVRPAQIRSYNTCLELYRDLVRWIAFIDIDEFLYPASGDSVLECLREFEAYPGLAVHWVVFSTSGHVLRPPGLVTENFVRCQPAGNIQVKLVVQPRRTVRFIDMHSARFVDGALAVNEQLTQANGRIVEPPSVDKIRINHYWTKSAEEFLLKKLPRGYDEAVMYTLQNRSAWGLVQAERTCAGGTDESIARFVPRLKDRLASTMTPDTVRPGPA